MGSNIISAIEGMRSQVSLDPRDQVMLTPLYQSQYLLPHKLALKVRQSAGDDVLDWGAGFGHFSYVQCSLGAEVTAYSPEADGYTEFVPDLVVLGEKAGFQVAITRGDDPLPFADNSFDVVVSVGVLEHIAECGGVEELAVQEVARVLRPGGCFLIVHLPQRTSVIEFLNRRLGTTHHQRQFSRRELRSLLLAGTFTEREFGRYGLLPTNRLAVRFGEKLDWKWSLRLRHLDRVLCIPFGRIAQNQYAIFQKPA